MRRPHTLTLPLTALLLTMAIPVHAEVIYGTTAANRGNQVFSFDSATPSTLLTLHEVTGFVGNPSNDEAIIGGIDIRPANGKLYGVSQNGRVYMLDPANGIATLASTLSSAQPLPTILNVAGIDFDPVADRLRVVTLDRGNFSVNVDTGETVVGGMLHFVPGDVQTNPFTLAIAYSNNSAVATATTLYAVTTGETLSGTSSYVLDVIDPPSAGTLHSVGLFGTFGGSGAGFDISGVSGTAYLGTFAGGFPGSSFYTVDLQTGQATRIGAIGDDRLRNVIGGIAAPVGAPQPIPEPASLALFAAGLVGLGLLGFRKHSARRNTKMLAESFQAGSPSLKLLKSRAYR